MLPANGAREDHFSQVASFFDQGVERIAMGNGRNALFDDGAIIEDFDDVVGAGQRLRATRSKAAKPLRLAVHVF
jgi:hypothetical protein